MLSTLLVVGVISHLCSAACLVGIAHHSFYSAVSPDKVFFSADYLIVSIINGYNI